MKHSFLDKYSDGHSAVHRLDSRAKIISVFIFILALALTPPTIWLAYLVYFLAGAGLILASRVPLRYILKRSLMIIPFVLLISIFMLFFKGGEVAFSFHIWLWQVSITYQGLQQMGLLLVRAWLSILALVLLTSTTRMTDLLNGLERLRLPRVMVMTLSFMYRYIFILTDEVMRMKQARDSRNCGGSKIFRVKTVGRMAGTLFIRSYERGERVYDAMLARGYGGRKALDSKL